MGNYSTVSFSLCLRNNIPDEILHELSEYHTYRYKNESDILYMNRLNKRPWYMYRFDLSFDILFTSKNEDESLYLDNINSFSNVLYLREYTNIKILFYRVAKGLGDYGVDAIIEHFKPYLVENHHNNVGKIYDEDGIPEFNRDILINP